ncbi:MAG: hypothetical protein GF334_12430 [Candidatus Altiarchaeales archaeon]|nr:hypothetical protein [Candidatus Altiarchaeales archaeon]
MHLGGRMMFGEITLSTADHERKLRCRSCQHFGDQDADIAAEEGEECLSPSSIYRGERRSHNDIACDCYILADWIRIAFQPRSE